MTDVHQIFDRGLVRRHRDRAAPLIAAHDELFREVAERLADRLVDVTRGFPRALDLGCHHGVLGRCLAGRGGIDTLVQCDLSFALARRAATTGRPTLVADEELLPFKPASFDLVMSVLSLHWVNDLPGALVQIRRALRPDGLFLAAFLGGDTLGELRAALLEAEMAEESGASPRVSPFADVQDAGALLQRAGFALPVVDRDEIRLAYPSTLALMRALRAMGETNAVMTRRRGPSRRATLARAAALYEARFGQAEDGLPATFQVITMTGWSPHDSQQQPLRPGAAATRLAEALGAREVSAGEKTRPK